MSMFLASSNDTKQQIGDASCTSSHNDFRRAHAVAVAATRLSYKGANSNSWAPLHFARHKSLRASDSWCTTSPRMLHIAARMVSTGE